MDISQHSQEKELLRFAHQRCDGNLVFTMPNGDEEASINTVISHSEAITFLTENGPGATISISGSYSSYRSRNSITPPTPVAAIRMRPFSVFVSHRHHSP